MAEHRAAEQRSAWYHEREKEEAGEHPIRAKTMPLSSEIDGPSLAMRSMVQRRRAEVATSRDEGD